MTKKSAAPGPLSRTAFWGLLFLGAAFVVFAFAGWRLAPVGSFAVPLIAGAAGAGAAVFLPALTRKLDKVSAGKLLLILLAVTLAVRAAWLISTRIDTTADFARMFRAAASLSSGAPVEDARYISMFPHTLGYPLFLSLVFRVTGPAVWAAQGFNLALSMLCCALIFFIARKYCKNGGGFAAALVWALIPAQAMQTSLVCNEILHLALTLAAILIFQTAADGGDGRSLPVTLAMWAALGAVVGVSSAVRPLGPVLLIAFALYFFVFSPSPFKSAVTRLRLEKLVPAAVMAIAFFFVSAVFTLWADGVLGQKTSGASMGWNLFVGMNTDSHGAWNRKDQELMAARMETDMTAGEIQDAFLSDGLARLSQNAKDGTLLPLMGDKFVRVWGHDYVVVEWLAQSKAPASPVNVGKKPEFDNLVTACDAGWFFLLGLAGAGLARAAARRGGRAFCLPVTILAGLVIAFMILEGNPRYHFPADALLCLIFPAVCENT